MRNIEVRRVDNFNDKLRIQLEGLFILMYNYMNDKGLHHRLTNGGEKYWIESVEKTLNKLGILCIALEDGSDERVVGFAHGTLKLLPSYLGGSKVGTITHVYVLPEFRRYGLGRRLVEELELWLFACGVESIELQVLHLNELGILFWREMGYNLELYQMRKKM